MSSFREWLRRVGPASFGLAATVVLVAAPAAAREAGDRAVQAVQATQPAAAQPSPQSRVFGSEAGLIFNPVKPGAAADFELVMARVKEALEKSPDPVRQEQAKSWRVYKALEPINEAIMYVFVVDPAVKGADYSVTKILAETFPDEVQALYEKFSAAFALAPSLVNMSLVQAMGQTGGVSELRLGGATR